MKKKQQALELQAQQRLQEQRQKDQTALQSRQQRIDALLAALPAQIQARIDAAEDDLVALCFESVCRMLGAAAATPEGIRAQVAHAREGLQGRPLVAVHLHPDDLAMLRAASGSEDSALQWVADPAVAVGGCILQSPQGGLDARLETQLRTLTELLTQARASARDAAAAQGR
ncbi:Flagellar assembly protein FliH [compost metagenome]